MKDIQAIVDQDRVDKINRLVPVVPNLNRRLDAVLRRALSELLIPRAPTQRPIGIRTTRRLLSRDAAIEAAVVRSRGPYFYRSEMCRFH